MRKPKIIIINLEEAKDFLAEYYVNFAKNDTQALKQAFLTGEAFWINIHNADDKKIIKTFGDLNLGEIIAVNQSHDAPEDFEQVAIETTDGNYEIVWDIENVEPQHRDWVYDQFYDEVMSPVERPKPVVKKSTIPQQILKDNPKIKIKLDGGFKNITDFLAMSKALGFKPLANQGNELVGRIPMHKLLMLKNIIGKSKQIEITIMEEKI